MTPAIPAPHEANFPLHPRVGLRAVRWACLVPVLALLAVPFVPAGQGHSSNAATGIPRALMNTFAGTEIQPEAVPGSATSAEFLGEPARPFVASYGDSASAERAERCLTEAIYYEGALESELGQRAIAQVVLNRVRHPAYPDNVCGVVFQGQERSTGCQFTFTCDGSRARPPVPNLWARANRVAKAALGGAVAAEVGLSTHYHADYVMPYWSASLDPSGQIGRHMFYRWRGANGQPGAFTTRYSGREPLIAAYTPRPSPVGEVPAERQPGLLGGQLTGEPGQAGLSTTAPSPAPAPAPFKARPLQLASKAADGTK